MSFTCEAYPRFFITTTLGLLRLNALSVWKLLSHDNFKFLCSLTLSVHVLTIHTLQLNHVFCNSLVKLSWMLTIRQERYRMKWRLYPFPRKIFGRTFSSTCPSFFPSPSPSPSLLPLLSRFDYNFGMFSYFDALSRLRSFFSSPLVSFWHIVPSLSLE